MFLQCASINPSSAQGVGGVRADRASGFSLIEVLVAFVVASVMALTFIGSQMSAFDMADRYAASWERMNLVATLLAERSKSSLEPAEDVWIPSSDFPDAQWLVEEGDLLRVSDYAYIRVPAGTDWQPPRIWPVTLRVSLRGDVTEWEWYRVAPR